MSPTEDLPPPLDDLLKYKFWYEDDRKQPRTRWFPNVDATDGEYSRLQQDLARDLATRLVEIRRDEPDAPSVEPASGPAARPPNGDHLVLVNGGDDDAALVQEVANRLRSDHNIGAILPLSALPEKNRLKSSEITRDLREKLKLCSAVLIVYKDGPAHQVHGQITEFLKVKPKRPKNRPEPTLDVCRPADGALPPGVYLPLIREFLCAPDCADCARRFAEGLP